MNRLNIGKNLYLKGRIGWQGLSKEEYLEKSDYKIINATALMDGFIDWNNCGFITKERYEEAKEIMLKENDILISKDGTLGKIGYVKNLTTPCSVASGVFVLRNTEPNLIDFDYLYHVLKSDIFKNFIKRNKALGSTIPHLYQRDLENFEIDIPSLSEQRRIAKILNDIDSKISNNNRINFELESMTKTLYDYWFLQFEFPNEEGKPYKSSGGKMVWNEQLKREIPEGWMISELGTIILENSKSKIQVGNANVQKGNIPFFTSGDDIIYVNNALVDGFNIYLNTGGNAGFKCYYGKANYSTDTWCIKGANDYIFWLAGYLSNILPYMNIKFFAGTGLKHLQKELLKKELIILPDAKTLKKYNSIIEKNYKEISLLKQENQKLASLRDFLLPLLMNGQAKIIE